MMRTRQQRAEAPERLRVDVRAGFDQLARGEGRSYDKASGRQLADRFKSRGRAALAQKP
jgi:hypothetical protein